MQIKERRYWIPAEIAVHPALSATHKALLSWIETLGGNDTGCWAGDRYLAHLAGVSPERLAQLLAQLERDGFLRTEADGFLPGSYGGRARLIRLIGYPERPEAER